MQHRENSRLRRVIGLAAAGLLAAAAPAATQSAAPQAEMPAAFTFTRIAAPPEPNALPLYPAGSGLAAGAGAEIWDIMGNGQRVVRNVARPTLTPFLPDPAKATGAAVIVAPGGGFKMLAMDNEGWPVAKWLADRGIAAFVLKYRLNQTAADEQVFMREMGAVFAAAMRSGARPDVHEPRATLDALQALRMVRSGAGKWGIDPKRVGMIGFSAGAMTTLRATLEGRADERPAFVGYIYGPMTAVDVPAEAPPMFAALALDDGLFGRQGFGIVDAWHKAGRGIEFHAYEKGDHGYGMGKPGTTTTLMMDQFRAWLEARGLLGRGGPR